LTSFTHLARDVTCIIIIGGILQYFIQRCFTKNRPTSELTQLLVANSRLSSIERSSTARMIPFSFTNVEVENDEEDIDNENIESSVSNDSSPDSSQLSSSDYECISSFGCNGNYDESNTDVSDSAPEENRSIAMIGISTPEVFSAFDVSCETEEDASDDSITIEGSNASMSTLVSSSVNESPTIVSSDCPESFEFLLFAEENEITNTDYDNFIRNYQDPSDDFLNWDRLIPELLKITEFEDDNSQA